MISKGSYYNCYSKCNGVYYLDDEINYYCLDSNKCPEQYNKSVPEKGQCTDDCTKIDNYQYEFRKICYNECPIDITYNNNYYCEIKCNKSYPFEIIENQICTDFCGINDMNNKLCKSKYKDEGTNENLILFNIRKDIISSNFDKDELNENNITLEEENTIFTITTNKLLEKNNISIEDLDECMNYLGNKDDLL